MTIKSSGTQLGFGEIETEFGAQSPRSLGSYRHSQTVNGLTFNGIDAGVPTSGEIKFSDFYSKSLNIVVDCYSGDDDETRVNAKTNKWNNNSIVIINPSSVSKKETGTKITIRVNKKFGSDKSNVNNCALRTGTWNNPASVIVDLGSSAQILGAGGNGGRGADGITNDGVDGGDGSSGLGIEHQGTVVNYRSGSVIRAGFGGGGGGGAGFPFGTGGAGGTPLAGTDPGGSSIGSAGGNGTETTGGNGGGGGDNEDQAGGQTGGVGGDNEQSPAAGPNSNSNGGAAGTNGAAIRESSGVSFTFGTGDLDNGTIEPSSFTNAANAQQGVA